jgi:hypothetical protein
MDFPVVSPMFPPRHRVLRDVPGLVGLRGGSLTDGRHRPRGHQPGGRLGRHTPGGPKRGQPVGFRLEVQFLAVFGYSNG